MKCRYLDEAQQKRVRSWWLAIQPQELDIPKRAKDDRPPRGEWLELGRAARAGLKRCSKLDDLLLEASALRLADRLLTLEAEKPSFRHFSGNYAAVALVAGALAHVRHDPQDGRSLAARVGGESPVMSELRFQRLMRTDDANDFLRQLARAIQLADDKADVVVLADDVIGWFVEQTYPPGNPNHRLKTRWARDYYLAPAQRALIEPSNAPTTEPATPETSA